MTALANVPEWMVPQGPEGLTAEEYEALPEEISRRIEIVDGVVLVTPSPRRAHQFIMFRLADDLYEAVGGRYQVTVDADLRLRDVPLLNRRPDIVVYDANLPSSAVLRAEHCVLVIEVMSPGSVTTDQTDKPAEYAKAGIMHFWRIEDIDEAKQALNVYRYMLDPTTGTYTSAGVDSAKLSVREPFELTIDLADLF